MPPADTGCSSRGLHPLKEAFRAKILYVALVIIPTVRSRDTFKRVPFPPRATWRSSGTAPTRREGLELLPQLSGFVQRAAALHTAHSTFPAPKVVVRVRACVCVSVSVCVCFCVCLCVHAHEHALGQSPACIMSAQRWFADHPACMLTSMLPNPLCFSGMLLEKYILSGKLPTLCLERR